MKARGQPGSLRTSFYGCKLLINPQPVLARSGNEPPTLSLTQFRTWGSEQVGAEKLGPGAVPGMPGTLPHPRQINLFLPFPLPGHESSSNSGSAGQVCVTSLPGTPRLAVSPQGAGWQPGWAESITWGETFYTCQEEPRTVGFILSSTPRSLTYFHRTMASQGTCGLERPVGCC